MYMYKEEKQGGGAYLWPNIPSKFFPFLPVVEVETSAKQTER